MSDLVLTGNAEERDESVAISSGVAVQFAMRRLHAILS